jgi:hypothetical protein
MKTSIEPTDADRKAADKLFAELEALGHLKDPHKAVKVVLASSVALRRALNKAEQPRKAKPTGTPRGNRLLLADGTLMRVEKTGHRLAVFMTERGGTERMLLEYGATKLQ